MKKLILVVALLTMVAFVSGVMAQGKPAALPLRRSPLLPLPRHRRLLPHLKNRRKLRNRPRLKNLWNG